MHWFGGGMWGWGIFGMILFWVAAIALTILVIRAITGSSTFGAGTGNHSAREILDKRFAKGELSKDEYLEMKRELSS